MLLFFSCTAFGQQFGITGRLSDSLGRPLPNAAVQLTAVADSSLVSFALSDRKGNFRIRGLEYGIYLLEITFLGYRPYAQTVSPPENGGILDLRNISLEPASQELEGVTVQGKRLPMRIHNDTLEFNAGAFGTRPNAAVEDLLKKLPGVEVDADGTIRAQGEEVDRVTVDGEEFFGDDPKIASRNLPAAAVDNVQVFDKKSDKAMFTGVDDGQEQKTINLELKEGYRKSTFGSITAGGGTDERFAGNASINRFNQGQQLSFLGMANNTNEQGFSIGDYLSFTNGPQGRRGGGPGFRIQTREAGPGASAGSQGPPLNTGQAVNGMMTNWAGGVNFRDAFSNKLEVSGNYFADYLNHETDQSLERINYLPDGSYRFLQNGLQQNDHTGHRAGTVLDYRPDSSNSFRLNASFNYHQTHTSSDNDSRTLGTDNETASSSRQTNLAEGNNLALNADLLYRRRFGKPGRTLSANMTLGLGDSRREGELEALSEFQQSDLPPEMIRQDNSESAGSRLVGAGLSYTEPLNANVFLELNYELRQQLNDVSRNVWDITPQAPSYNELLSSEYESDYRYQRGGLNFQLNGNSYHITAGMNYQQSRLNGELLLRDTVISRDFQSFLPSLQFRYDFPGDRHLEFDYRTRLREPSIEELQPVTDNSDPLNLYKGNPDLRPAYMHQARLHFMTFDPSSLIHFFTFLDLNYMTDAISYSQTVNEQFVRTTQPVNAGEQVELRANANFGFPLSELNSRLGFSAGANSTRGTSLLNGAENRTRQQEISAGLRYNYRPGELLDLTLSGNISRQQNRFESGEDQLFINQRYQAQANCSFFENYGLEVNFGYLLYNSHPGEFNQEIPLLDVSLSRYVFKNKSGEIRLSVDNLLDKDLGVSQQAGANYIERSVTESLGRYAMLSFTYAINKQLNPANQRRGKMIHIGR